MKSIEELARELVESIEVDSLFTDGSVSELRNSEEYTALKSALEKPVEKEAEWPQWYRCPRGDLYRFDAPNQSGSRWSATAQDWGHLGDAYPLTDIQREFGVVSIPSAEALAIIEKAK